MLTDPNNELRELFADNIAEYFDGELLTTAQDIAGATVNAATLEGTKNSVVKNANGNLIPVYHGTGSLFSLFQRSDIGMHFGSYAQAVQRVKDKGIKKPRYIKAYLNITNPLTIDEDFFGWNAPQIAMNNLENEMLAREEAEQTIQYLINQAE